MPSSYRSPPPSYMSNDINPPPSYSSRARQDSRHSSSYLSSTVSSTSDCSSETSTSRTVSSTSYPSSGTSDSSLSPSSRSHLHQHSRFHNHNHSYYNTTDGHSRPANSPINADTSEATPLLKPTSHSFTISEKNERRYLRIATLLFVVLTCCYWSGLFSKKSDLTSFWIDITPAPTCHAVGVREYTATLAGKPEDWGHIQACQKTPFVIHGKPVNATPSCSLFHVLSNDTTTSGYIHVVQGRWLVDFDESDCLPVWLPMESDVCVAPGKRSYHAELDYVPPGLDQLTSCRDAPAVIHGRSVFSDRCDVVVKDGEGTRDDTLVVRGYWEIDFSEPSCEPLWTSVTDLHCQAYDRRRYTAILEEIPWELDPLETCHKFPLWLSGSYRTPETCEQEDGHGRVVGSWFIESPECRPVLKNIQDYGCMESGFKRVEGEAVDFGRWEDWYPICTTIPLHWGRTYLPEQCEARTSWFHTRRYAMYKIPAWYCR